MNYTFRIELVVDEDIAKLQTQEQVMSYIVNQVEQAPEIIVDYIIEEH
jgi:hypothetical protein